MESLAKAVRWAALGELMKPVSREEGPAGKGRDDVRVERNGESVRWSRAEVPALAAGAGVEGGPGPGRGLGVSGVFKGCTFTRKTGKKS